MTMKTVSWGEVDTSVTFLNNILAVEGAVPAAADYFIVQVGREASQVHIVIHKHKLQLSWSAQIWNTHTND